MNERCPEGFCVLGGGRGGGGRAPPPPPPLSSSATKSLTDADHFGMIRTAQRRFAPTVIGITRNSDRHQIGMSDRHRRNTQSPSKSRSFLTRPSSAHPRYSDISECWSDARKTS